MRGLLSGGSVSSCSFLVWMQRMTRVTLRQHGSKKFTQLGSRAPQTAHRVGFGDTKFASGFCDASAPWACEFPDFTVVVSQAGNGAQQRSEERRGGKEC